MPPNSTEQTIRPEDLREGDRVTISFPAVVAAPLRREIIQVSVDGGASAPSVFHTRDFPHLTITRLPKPLEVGDRVRLATHPKAPPCALDTGTIKAVDERHAWVRWDTVAPNSTEPLSSLTRIEEA